MCGIWGRVTRNRPILREELIGPVRKLAHRGPDGYGFYHDPKDPRVALVHLRLSIVDLAGGAQPLMSHDDRYIGIVNGELYDYNHHREAMIARGIRFRTKSDSEVLLNLFATGGTEALSPLSGEFAFIFFDQKERKLHFGRDLHGVKPLFMRQDAETLTLSSEVKALQDGTPVLDEIYVKRFLARMLVPPRTAVEGAFHVLPGRVYTYDPATGKLTWKAYQRVPLNVERKLGGQDAIERVRYELDGAVKRRLVADVEVGTYLSGGIDSALVAALMVKNGAKPKAFTVGFSEPEFDESAKAAAIAKHLGVEHHIIQMTGRNFLPHLKRSIIAFENPIANPHGAAKNLLASLAHQHVKVVLSGEGADEWFGGYAYLRIQKLRRFTERHPRLGAGMMEAFLKREGKAGAKHLDGNSVSANDLISPYFRGKVPAVFGRVSRRRLTRYTSQNDFDRFIRDAAAELGQYMEEDFLQGEPLRSETDLNVWTSMRTDLLHYILGNLGDRQEMSHSLEGRTPFMDQRLVTLAGQLDPNIMLRGLTEKHVLRVSARELLPMASSRQRKHAFFAPLKYMMLKDVRLAMDEHVKIAEKAAPWLPWRNLNHLMYLQKAPTGFNRMRELGFVVKVMLFSLGVLVDGLDTPVCMNPRGFRLPETVKDLEGHEFSPKIGAR